LLFNLHTMEWDDELLGLFGVPRALLPRVVSSSGIVGHTHADVFGRPIPIAGMAGDQHAATFGQRCIRPGRAKCTYGTGCFLVAHTGADVAQSDHGLLTTVAWRLGSAEAEYALEGSVFVAGAAVQWLRDGLGLIRSSSDVEALAASVPDSGGVVFVPAFAGLGAPHWDADARGTLVGLTRGTTAAHIARATLEAIALQVADVVDAIARDTGHPLTELRVDGGASANDLLMQLQADVLGIGVVRPSDVETTARGAAYLAGRAIGLWTDADLNGFGQYDRRFGPTMPRDQIKRMRAEWARAVERSRGWHIDADA
jgi:glycerol kinase